MPHTVAYPTRREIERKLSLRSATDDTLAPLQPQQQHAPSTSPLPVTHFGSPSVGETYTTTGTATASAAGMSGDDLDDLDNIDEEEEVDDFSEGEMMGLPETGECSDDGDAHRLGAVAAQTNPTPQHVTAPDVPPIDEDLRRRMEGERLVKSGYLMKKGERRKTWKKRWFVLRTEKLAYYKDEKEYVLCRILNLRDIHSVLAVQLKKNQHHTIGLVTSSRTYYVRAGTAAEMEAWIRALNETRRALAERDELVERADERRRAASKGSAVTPGVAVPIPERTTAGHPDQSWSATAPLSESMSAMSLSTSARSSHAHATGHILPAALSGEMHDTPRKQSVSSPHVVEQGRSLAPPNATRSNLSTSATTTSGNEFEEYGMTPVVSGVSVGAGLITSSESEDDGCGRAFDYGRNGSGSVGRTIDFDDGQQNPQHQTLSPVSNMTSPTITSPAGNYGSSLASSLPINGNPPPLPIQTDPHKVILSGYLTKLGNKRKTWRKRWFVLTSGELVYTKSHMDTRIHRSIPLSCMLDALEFDALPSPDSAGDSSSDGGNVSDGNGPPTTTSPRARGSTKSRTNSHSSRRFVGSHPASSTAGGTGQSSSPFSAQWQHTFQVVTPKRTFKLCAPTEEEEIKWLAALRALINRERGVTSPGASGNPYANRQTSLPPAVGITRASPPTNTIAIPPASAPVAISSPISTRPPTEAHEATSAPSARRADLPTSESITDHASYFPLQPSASATSPPASTSTTKHAGTPSLPPLITNQSRRTRSATQSAKAAVADVVRRFHPETSHHQHTQTQT